MLRNYFKIALRNLLKYKVFSLVNIIGLATGLAAFWLIFLYVANELSYDRHHKDADKIYRVVSHAKWDGGSFDITGTSAPFASVLKTHFPQIAQTVRIEPEGGGILSFGDKHIEEGAICFADKSMFDVFSYHFIHGSAKTALTEPGSIVLARTLAIKLFGSPEKAFNQTVTLDGRPHRVTGVIEDIQANSHLIFNALRSMPANFTEGWGELHLITYLKLSKATDIELVGRQLRDFSDKYVNPRMKAAGFNGDFRIELQPLTSIHLHSNLQGETGEIGKMSNLYIFSGIGILILIIAAINYMNLSTARASLRVKEIAIRKVNGSSRRNLTAQFLAEAIFLSLIAAIAGLLIVHFSLPWYNQLTGKEVDIWYFGIGQTVLALLSFAFLTGLVSGTYPAWFLSGFRLIPALKGKGSNASDGITFRKTLVVFQFLITICMISASLIIYQQLNYVSKKDLGFNKSQVLTFHLDNEDVRNRIPALKSELLKNQLVESVGAAGLPIGKNVMSMGIYAVESNGVIEKKPRTAHYLEIDEDFLTTLQLNLASGRNYSRSYPGDSSASIVVNETLVKLAGWKNPIGKKLRVDEDKPVTVVGVVKDFHLFSLQHKIEPILMPLTPKPAKADNLYVRVSRANVPAALKFIEQTFRKFDNATPFNYSFLDANFEKRYKNEQQQANILLTFTILAILIACMGLFGLVSFMLEQRTKEIGIRKVLGAGIKDIIVLISKDFIKIVLVSAAIAFPLAWYAMRKWLQNFAYKIDMDWWVFGVAGLVAVIIALLTIGLRALKAASANPVKSLRTE